MLFWCVLLRASELLLLCEGRVMDGQPAEAVAASAKAQPTATANSGPSRASSALAAVNGRNDSPMNNDQATAARQQIQAHRRCYL